MEYTLHNDFGWLGKFAEENAALPDPAPGEKRVVFMGNSITEGWSNFHPAFFTENPYIERGIGGQTTPQMLVRFRQDVIDLQPSAVVILAGTNDIAGNTGPMTLEQTFANLVSMAELAQAHGIKVLLCSVHPVYDYPWKPGLEPASKIVKLNQMIKDYAATHGCWYVDYFSAMVDERNGLQAQLGSDGVHPNKAGYDIMEPIVQAVLADALGQ
ncbi:MAG: SGNH/GDSL hydrolase family protein [Bacteroidia bacterium]|nr:SGNH/GDSL hydrolase family protein [Bacteroidia bacterium]